MKITFFHLLSVGSIALLSILLWKSTQENKLLKSHLLESLKMIEHVNTDMLPAQNRYNLQLMNSANKIMSNGTQYFGNVYPITCAFDTLMNCIQQDDFSQNHRLANKILNRDTIFREIMQRRKFLVSDWSVLAEVLPFHDSLIHAAIKTRYRFETAYIQSNYIRYMADRIGCCRGCPDMFSEERMKCLILPQSTTVKLGEALQANVVLASCASPLFMSLSINGSSYKMDIDSGYVKMATIAETRLGEHVAYAYYTIINPNTGEKHGVKGELKYHVVPK
jgi:hypothetical protein